MQGCGSGPNGFLTIKDGPLERYKAAGQPCVVLILAFVVWSLISCELRSTFDS